MKPIVLSALALIFISQISIAQVPDRKNLGNGIIAITHSENFEYACKIKIKESGEFVQEIIWIDDNFNKKSEGAPVTKNFRVAQSFPLDENNKIKNIGGMIGLESKIRVALRGRCRETCYRLEGQIFNAENKREPIVYEMNETGLNTREYNLKVTNAAQEVFLGTCRTNDVE